MNGWPTVDTDRKLVTREPGSHAELQRSTAALLVLAGLVVWSTPLDYLIVIDIPLFRNISAVAGWALLVGYAWSSAGRVVLDSRAQVWSIVFLVVVGILELSRLLGADWFGYPGTPSIPRTLSLYMTWVQPIVLFLLVSMIARDRRSARLVFLGLPLVTATMSLNMLSAGETQRWAPLGLNANFAGVMFGLALIVGLYYTLFARRDQVLALSAALALTIPLNLIGLLGSGSRTASAATAIGVIALLALSKLSMKQWATAAVVALTAGASLLPLFAPFSEVLRTRWEQTVANEDFGVRDRLLVVTTQLFTERPLAGYGLTSSRAIGERWQGVPDRAFDAHNTIMTLLVTFGVVGSFPWFALVALAVAHAFRHRHSEDAPLVIALLAVFMTYMLAGNVTSNKLFFVTLGLAMCVHAWHWPLVSRTQDKSGPRSAVAK